MTYALTYDAQPPALEPARVSGWLLWAVAALTFATILWAGLARVDEVASAPGRVVPAGQLQVVSNLEGGIVAQILVRPGTTVVAGQPLIRLDRGQIGADYGRTSAAYDALAVRVARLSAEAGGHAPVFAAAPELAATERALYAARRDEGAAATAIEAAKLAQAERRLGEAQSDAASRGSAATLAAQEVAMVAPLVDKGIEPRITLLRATTSLDQARGATVGAALAVRRAHAAVAEASAGLRGVGDRFRAQASEQLVLARAELVAQGVALPAAKDRLSRTVVRAPVSGTVNRVLVATVGGSIRPGEPLVEIVPRGDALVVEARVKPADVAFVHPGQRATVKLTAYDYSVYGSLAGTVERISPDAIVDERTGESHYAVRVRTAGQALKGQDGRALPVGAGMIAEVDLLGHKRSVLSYLLTPVTKLTDNAFREK